MDDFTAVLIAVERHMDRSAEFRARLMAYLVRVGLMAPCREQILGYRIQAARELLRSGAPRREAQQMLRDRFGVSRATAYRLLDQALKIGRL